MNKGTPKKKAGKQKPQSPSLNQALTGEASDAGSMDKIRDILFGNQAKEYEKRFSRMEAQLFKEISEVRESSQKRLETLETYFKKELTVIKERLQNEIEERADAEKKIAAGIQRCHILPGEKNRQIGRIRYRTCNRSA